MRSLFVIAAVTVIASARASFDMMLVNETTNFGVKIHRIDPTNNAYLGYFAGPSSLQGGVTGIAGSAVNKSAYVCTSNFVFQYDYSNGSVQHTVNTGGNCVSLSQDQGTLLVGTSTGISTYGATSLTSNGQLVSGINVIGIAGYSGYIWATLSDGSLRCYSSAGVLQSSYAASTFSNQTKELAVMRNQGTSSTDELLAVNGSATENYAYLNSPGSTMFGNGGQVQSEFAALYGVTSAHQGCYFVGQDSGSSLARIAHANTQDNYVDWSYTTTSFGISSATRVGIVLAPEPGTWAAMGLGLVALTRRRSKR